ncbi:DnaJ-like protein subfamily C member 27-A [Armadillidium nasatum]|uniref:DnaJ-like protein subfamily C member 27 n=1 Tax=Armadillidium nasatum TaxID=96803 RepID=A0A5N5SZM6_9CRUS|nr:DnaJ-like protein subfamily C member 27 [Armadillidium nasatum]KAB7500658.1 DnaJ-like protein subfamily C member 27-A [Armadillidium nasatum]
MEHRNNGKQTVRIRILSLGNSGTGKSCLIKRYCEKRFSAKYVPTIGIDYGSTIVDVDGRRLSVHFFDTSGSPLFKDEGWNLVVVVCGTRTDTGGAHGRQVSETDGRSWAEKHKFPHILTSAALGVGVTQAFYTIFVQALQLKDGMKPQNIAPHIHDPEVTQAINRLKHGQDDFEKLSLARRGISKDDITKSYRKLAGLVHPDKCKEAGAEEAFKILNQAKNNLLKLVSETTV